MENTIMENNEVLEVTEEIATTRSGKAVKAVVGTGVALLVGTIIYKKLLKPIAAKLKAKKEAKKVAVAEAKDEDLRIFDEEGNPIEK